MRFLLIICLFVMAGHHVDSAPKTSDGSCVPGTTWEQDCNHCVCGSNGVGMCTLIGCLSAEEVLKFKLNSPGDCLPGSSWRSECNDCVCTNDGDASCTKQLYPGCENEPVRLCAPDTKWKDDRYNCECAVDGRTSSCTLIHQ